MIEWLWESFLLFIRIFVISIITAVTAGAGYLLAWWNGNLP